MRTATATAVIGLALVLSACGPGAGEVAPTTGPTTPASSPSSAPTPTDTGAPVDDKALVEAMLTHHEQGLEVVGMALDKRHEAAPDVVAAARRSRAALLDQHTAMQQLLGGPSAAATIITTPTQATDPARDSRPDGADEDNLEDPGTEGLDEPAVGSLDNTDELDEAPATAPGGDGPGENTHQPENATAPSNAPPTPGVPAEPTAAASTASAATDDPLAPELIDPNALENLAAAKGEHFSRMWLAVLINHQSDTLDMAVKIRGVAQNQQVRDLADDVARTTEPRVKLLRELLAARTGEAPEPTPAAATSN